MHLFSHVPFQRSVYLRTYAGTGILRVPRGRDLNGDQEDRRERHAAYRRKVGIPESSTERLRDLTAKSSGTLDCSEANDPVVVFSAGRNLMTRMLPTQK